MDTFAAIIKILGGYQKLAGALDLPKGTVSAMQTRDSIPPEHWSAVVAEAAKQGHDGITLERLAALRQPRQKRSAPVPADAAA